MRARSLRSIVALSLALAAVAVAGPMFNLPDEELPASPAARGALAKFAKAKEDAQRAFDATMKKATDDCVAQLEKARTEVMKAGNASALDEANKIGVLIDAVKADGPAGRFRVPAGPNATPAGVVKKGQKIEISASGTWCSDTSKRAEWTLGAGPIKRGGNTWGLYARIGDGQPFVVGSSWQGEAEESGQITLFLSGGPSTRPENDDGSIDVTLRVW